MAATYRNLYVTFWNDEFILSLSPEEKLFYNYLLTNQYVNFCGIYVLTIKMMMRETGLSSQKIKKTLNFLSENGKVVYSKLTDEVCLCNWLKHNCNKSPKQIKGILSNLQLVKDRNLLKYLTGLKEITDTLSDTPSCNQNSPLGITKELKQEQELYKQEQEQKDNAAAAENIPEDKFSFVQYFASKLIVPNEIFKDKLLELEEIYPPLMLIEATDIYGKKAGKSINFLEAILRNLEKGGGYSAKFSAKQAANLSAPATQTEYDIYG